MQVFDLQFASIHFSLFRSPLPSLIIIVVLATRHWFILTPSYLSNKLCSPYHRYQSPHPPSFPSSFVPSFHSMNLHFMNSSNGRKQGKETQKGAIYGGSFEWQGGRDSLPYQCYLEGREKECLMSGQWILGQKVNAARSNGIVER